MLNAAFEQSKQAPSLVAVLIALAIRLMPAQPPHTIAVVKIPFYRTTGIIQLGTFHADLALEFAEFRTSRERKDTSWLCRIMIQRDASCPELLNNHRPSMGTDTIEHSPTILLSVTSLTDDRPAESAHLQCGKWIC